MPTRIRRNPLAAMITVLATAAAGCGSADREPPRSTDGDGLRLEREWRMDVQETDSIFLSRPGEIAIDPVDGSFYIADGFAGHVVQVDRRGVPVRVFGRKGRGPGEFTQVGQMAPFADLLLVENSGQGALNLFRRGSGQFVKARPHDGILNDYALAGDTGWFGLQSVERGTSVGRWTAGDDRLDYLVPLPKEYRESQPLAGIFNGVSLAKWADTLVVGLAGSNRLLLVGARGEPLDTVTLPVARRRGVPDDIARRLEKMDFPAMFSSISALFDIGRLSDGRIALVHYDQEIAGPRIMADVYLTVLSPDRKRACVDARLPVTRDSQPYTAFRGDTLFVLEQKLEDAGTGQPKTSITAYRLSTERCRWTAVE